MHIHDAPLLSGPMQSAQDDYVNFLGSRNILIGILFTSIHYPRKLKLGYFDPLYLGQQRLNNYSMAIE